MAKSPEGQAPRLNETERLKQRDQFIVMWLKNQQALEQAIQRRESNGEVYWRLLRQQAVILDQLFPLLKFSHRWPGQLELSRQALQDLTHRLLTTAVFDELVVGTRLIRQQFADLLELSGLTTSTFETPIVADSPRVDSDPTWTDSEPDESA